VKLAERRRRIAARKSPPKTDRIWAAGHFEGEGTLSIVHYGEGNGTRPVANLSSTDWSMVEFFHERWPGYLVAYTPKSGRARELLTWYLYGLDQIEGFILDIRPFLRSERVRTKAVLLLEDIRARAEGRRSPEARRRKAERHMRMRELNRRGVEAEGPSPQSDRRGGATAVGVKWMRGARPRPVRYRRANGTFKPAFAETSGVAIEEAEDGPKPSLGQTGRKQRIAVMRFVLMVLVAQGLNVAGYREVRRNPQHLGGVAPRTRLVTGGAHGGGEAGMDLLVEC
jgi:hypothetical protein